MTGLFVMTEGADPYNFEGFAEYLVHSVFRRLSSLAYRQRFSEASSRHVTKLAKQVRIAVSTQL